MAYRGLPEHLLQAVSPEAFRHHVVACGWSLSASQAGRFDVFNQPERELDQVLILLNIAAPDYSRRIGDAVLALSEVEGRPAERVLADLLRAGHLGHFRIPGDATRRDYAVYIMVATHRSAGERQCYVGKTGDNRVGCNPVISRAGNHFSFNKKHSQMRNQLEEEGPEKYDFDYFYTTFGTYECSSQGRESLDLINEMERRLNGLAQEAFGAAVIKPYLGKGRLSREEKEKRNALASPGHLRPQADALGGKAINHRGLKGRESFFHNRPGSGSRDLSGRRAAGPVDPGHRPTAEALGYGLPARWAGRPTTSFEKVSSRLELRLDFLVAEVDRGDADLPQLIEECQPIHFGESGSLPRREAAELEKLCRRQKAELNCELAVRQLEDLRNPGRVRDQSLFCSLRFRAHRVSLQLESLPPRPQFSGPAGGGPPPGPTRAPVAVRSSLRDRAPIHRPRRSARRDLRAGRRARPRH